MPPGSRRRHHLEVRVLEAFHQTVRARRRHDTAHDVVSRPAVTPDGLAVVPGVMARDASSASP